MRENKCVVKRQSYSLTHRAYTVPRQMMNASNDAMYVLTFGYMYYSITMIRSKLNTVKPAFKTACEIWTTWELRRATSVPRPI